jgi:hypothetical protein
MISEQVRVSQPMEEEEKEEEEGMRRSRRRRHRKTAYANYFYNK